MRKTQIETLPSIKGPILHQVVNRKLRKVGVDWGSFFGGTEVRGKYGFMVKSGLYFEEVGLYVL